MKLVPSDWKVVRGLLTFLGLGALVLATLSLTDPTWVRGPLPVAIAMYVGTPLAVAALGVLTARRWPSARLPAVVMAVSAGIAVIANVTLIVMVKHWSDELREAAPRRCDRLPECDELVAGKFGTKPRPRIPTQASVDRYRFVYAQESGRLLGFWYAPPGSDEPSLVFMVSRRRPDGYEPPIDTTVYRASPRGTRFVEGGGPRVARLDFWDDTFHYAVSLQGEYDRSSPEYERAVALIDTTG